MEEETVNVPEDIALFLEKRLERGEIDEVKFNLITLLVATYGNDMTAVSKLSNDLSSVRYHVSDKFDAIRKAKADKERKEWEGSVVVGTRVEVRVGQTRRRTGDRHYASVTKIYKGKFGMVYTVKLDDPHVYWRRDRYTYHNRRHEKFIFKYFLKDMKAV